MNAFCAFIPVISLIVLLVSVLIYHRLTDPPLTQIIAGKVTELIPLPNKGRYRRAFNGFVAEEDGKRLTAEEFPVIGTLVGDSLKEFELPSGTIVFCEQVTVEEVERGDILILRIDEGPNVGKDKARVCLGLWGPEDQPDEDLKLVACYEGNVRQYFSVESPKYRKDGKPYSGRIEGYLKTLSAENSIMKISRPHNPDTLLGRVKYTVKQSSMMLKQMGQVSATSSS